MTHSLSNSLRAVVVAKLPQRIYAAAANYTNLAVAAVVVVVVDLTQARCHCARLHWAHVVVAVVLKALAHRKLESIFGNLRYLPNINMQNGYAN